MKGVTVWGQGNSVVIKTTGKDGTTVELTKREALQVLVALKAILE